jgi:CBS domain-containing protein
MPANATVRDVMTTDVATLAPEDTIQQAADRLAARRVGAMPVVDGAGRLIGLLRDEDLIVSEARLHVPTTISFLGASFTLPGEMKRFEEELHKVAGATVGDVMDDEPPTIAPDATLEDLATLMHERDVTHVPVVDSGGHVVGIVARGDLVRFIARTT